ncbi:MAG: chemotaxis protein CheW, partial [Moorea sp. SIO3I7]|nr:chemotaxis protein CheW [Moorena sp. SIO3I7]
MQYKTSNQPIFNDCWNQIGVTGDRSCPELKTFIHCR